jgi:hypothetical protein
MWVRLNSCDRKWNDETNLGACHDLHNCMCNLLLRLFSQDFHRVLGIRYHDLYSITSTTSWECRPRMLLHTTSVGQDTGIWFINNYWFQFFWVAYQNQRIVNSAYLKIRNQRTISCFQLFWKPQRTILFHEVTIQESMVFSGVVIWLVLILRTMVMYNKQGIWYLAMVVMSVENHHDT